MHGSAEVDRPWGRALRRFAEHTLKHTANATERSSGDYQTPSRQMYVLVPMNIVVVVVMVVAVEVVVVIVVVVMVGVEVVVVVVEVV